MRSVSRISCRAWAVAVLAFFAVAGAAVVGDYGVSMDTQGQRQIAAANLEYVLGADDALSAGAGYLPVAHDRYYGMAFEAPLLLAERALGLDDSRTAYLLRHYATHLFWLGGGFACFLLARRLFDSGPIALLAMLLFLLQPRLYAHAFFNSKDVPFLSMFMIALCLIHRAFEKDTVRAFVVLGMGTAVLTNLRIMGVMLFAAVLGMRALDLLHAAQRSERRRVLKSAAAFGAACAATLYAISPYLWSDPRQFAEALRILSEHPHSGWQLFQGRFVRPDDLPWSYVPTWMAVTTPPFTLLLGCAGVVGVAWRAAARPGRALRNTPLRFGLLLTACLTAPPLAVAALGANTHNGWRHLYFLHAPLALLAASGLRRAASRDAARVRRGAYAAAARARYDVRFNAARGALTYARAPCVPADVDLVRFFLHVVPVDPDDLPDDQVRYGFEHRDFNLPDQALFDGKCLATIRLPEYAVDHVRTGQSERKDGVWTALWEETIRIEQRTMR